MKKSIKLIIVFILGGIFFTTAFSYAITYNSEEISYDTSTSGAIQANVKDALDFLYNKTKSGASAECPENMSCIEKPGIVISVTGPGSVNKGTVYVGLDDSSTFIVTPDEGYTLHSISCDNGYTLGSFKTLSTEATSPQEITITNPGTTTGAACQVKFSTNEISVSSGTSDPCNNNGDNCICYKIHNNITDFTYGNHTGCNFKSYSCMNTAGSTHDCAKLMYSYGDYYWHAQYGASVSNVKSGCSGVITCET